MQVERLLSAKTADLMTAEKKLLDRNEKIHKLFRQLSAQRDDYESKLQDLQQVYLHMSSLCYYASSLRAHTLVQLKADSRCTS